MCRGGSRNRAIPRSTMSAFEDYDVVSRNYDANRGPIGLETVSAFIQFYTNKPLQELHVFDAGCGTGNYTKALLELGVGQVTMVDASPGMIMKAKEKLNDEFEKGRVKFVENLLPSLPFPDDTFDVVMFNMVLHHLDKHRENNTDEYPNITTAMKEASRVLRKGGVVSITTTLRGQFQKGVWNYQLHEEITLIYAPILQTSDFNKKAFAEAGIDMKQKLSLLDVPLVTNHDFYEGPLHKEWRDSDSYWSYATEAEVDEVKKRIWAMKKAGTLEEWCKEHDKTSTNGAITVIIGTVL
ncbi:demethylmenaquinone methyltransferase-like isoform X1 [Mya arenaria]|nr:demethylmenaquinone methyltransferase-like isoform X1 [Mya arenaria]